MLKTKEIYTKIYDEVSQVKYTLLNTNGLDVTKTDLDVKNPSKCRIVGGKSLLLPKNMKGTCYDQAICIAYLLNKHKIKYKCVFVKFQDQSTHLVTHAIHNSLNTVIETAWESKKGIHPIGGNILSYFGKLNIIEYDIDVKVSKFFTNKYYNFTDLFKILKLTKA